MVSIVCRCHIGLGLLESAQHILHIAHGHRQVPNFIQLFRLQCSAQITRSDLVGRRAHLAQRAHDHVADHQQPGTRLISSTVISAAIAKVLRNNGTSVVYSSR